MSYSSLVKSYMPAASNNTWGARKEPIRKIIIHHMAAKWTAERCAQSFQSASRGASASYCIGYNGDIVCSLDESITPGTSGGYEADKDAVTIEVANSSSGNGNWPVSDKTLDSLIKLVADVAKRNNLGTLVKGQNVTWHSMYAATACPGPYLISKMDYIVAEANRLNQGDALPFRKISGTNRARSAGYLVRYTNGGATTGTNVWGAEAIINSEGYVTNNPKYGACNNKIPVGGSVLSGHDNASSWILSNIKKGYTVVFENGGATVVPTGYNRYINGVNISRQTDALVLYKNKATTGTNIWGCEVVCDANGIVLEVRHVGKGNAAIPSGGFVLSGHNNSGYWLRDNIRVGMRVSISNNQVFFG